MKDFTDGYGDYFNAVEYSQTATLICRTLQQRIMPSGNKVWGKAGLRLHCEDCQSEFVEEDREDEED